MKVAIVGLGSRHKIYRDAVIGDYAEKHSLVAVCDNNSHRLDLAAKAAKAGGQHNVVAYHAGDFGRMLEEQKPDILVVTTPDYLHDEHITAACAARCDIVCEKPMTIDLEKLKSIISAREKSGRTITVTFNYRYAPAHTQVKDLLMKNTIGEITSVDFRWYLDRVHGADYFRRWHRKKANSGGLLVHKATHHFDLLNWWLASTPTKVMASGRRSFYTPETALSLGLENRGERCADCQVFEKCDFRLDLRADEHLNTLYKQAETHDGYLRDRCVFDADIDIEDVMQAHIGFASGISANYGLIAYAPWEGLEVTFQGTKGELVHRHVQVHGVFGGSRRKAGNESVNTVLHLAGKEPKELDVWTGEGDHGGADPVMLASIFDRENTPYDPYARASDHVMGGWSVLTGIAANKSIETGKIIDIDEMLHHHEIDLPRPSANGPF